MNIQKEQLANYDIDINIDLIEKISGGNEEFEIFFCTKEQEKYKLIFDIVWDLRYSIENASIDRFCEFRKNLPSDIKESSVYIVKDSEYIKYFEQQVSGTRPIDELVHFIVHDNVDTTLDILTLRDPVLVKL